MHIFYEFYLCMCMSDEISCNIFYRGLKTQSSPKHTFVITQNNKGIFPFEKYNNIMAEELEEDTIDVQLSENVIVLGIAIAIVRFISKIIVL